MIIAEEKAEMEMKSRRVGERLHNRERPAPGPHTTACLLTRWAGVLRTLLHAAGAKALDQA